MNRCISALLILLVLFLSSCVNPVNSDTEDIQVYKDGYSAYSNKQYTEAIVFFKKVVDEYPWSSKVDNSLEYWGKSEVNLAEIASDSSDIHNHYLNAIDAFSKIPKKSNGYAEAQFLIGEVKSELYKHSGDPDFQSLVTHFKSLSTEWPSGEYGEKSLFAITELYYDHDEFDSSIVYGKGAYSTVTTSSNQKSKVLNILGHSYREKDLLDSSFSWFVVLTDSSLFSGTDYYDNGIYWAGSVAEDRGEDSTAIYYLERYLNEFPSGSYADNATKLLNSLNSGD